MTTTVRGHLRGLQVLEALSDLRIATASQIADCIDLPRSTVHRLLMTLIEAGYANQVGGGKYFSLARKVGHLASGYDDLIETLEVAEPLVRELSERINWSCYLHSVEGDEIVTRVVVRSKREFSYSPLGTRLPMAYFSPGRAHLARLPEEERERILRKAVDYRARDNGRPESLEALRAIVRQTQIRGYGFRKNGVVPRTGSFAVPINKDGHPVVYLTVKVMLASSTLERAVEAYMPMVAETVREIEKRLPGGGYQAWKDVNISANQAA